MKQFALMIILGAVAQVQAAIPPEQAIELCRAEQNALRRLNCYDSINTQTAQQQTSAGTTITADAPKAASIEEEFGKEHRNVISENSPDQVYMTVKKVSYDPYKSLIVEFDNGQVWQQLGTEYYSIKVGEQHYVKRGVLGSFFLGNDDNNRTIRVKREQ